MEQACRVLKISRSGCYGRARRNPCFAEAEESDASAEIDGTAPKRSRPGPGQSLSPAQAGIRLFPQACPPADAACGDRLCREAGPAKSPPTPGTATPSSPLYSKETSFLSNPIRPGWVISPAFPPERAGLYPAIVKGLCTGKRVGYAFSSPIDTAPTLESLGRAVRRLRRHERASPRMSRIHFAFSRCFASVFPGRTQG